MHLGMPNEDKSGLRGKEQPWSEAILLQAPALGTLGKSFSYL